MLEPNSVAKTAHRLTAKSCWPSSLRQNVNLALRIFDDSTAAALTVHALNNDQVSETAQFINLICKIWKIFNVITPNKGIRLNDELSMPLQNSDVRFQFLSEVTKWLENGNLYLISTENSLPKLLPVFGIHVSSLNR